MEGIVAERRYAPWRRQFWPPVCGHEILEASVGTGKNLPYYSAATSITVIDLTPGMGVRAQKRAAALGLTVNFQLGDVQALSFPNATRRSKQPAQGLHQDTLVSRPTCTKIP